MAPMLRLAPRRATLMPKLGAISLLLGCSAPRVDLPHSDTHIVASSDASTEQDDGLDQGKVLDSSPAMPRSQVSVDGDGGTSRQPAADGGRPAERAANLPKACAGPDPWLGLTSDQRCREHSECPERWRCEAAPRAAPSCGSPCPGCFPSDCSQDADCPDGVCEPYGPFASLMCKSRCKDGLCLPGQRCEADGHCRVHPCADGFACGQQRRCNPSAMLADANGCEPIPCYETGGVTCPAEQACVNDGSPHSATLPGCLAVPCNDPRHPGCSENRRCSSQASCQPLSCKTDADCDCGSCINAAISGSGICASGLGGCQSATIDCPP